MKRQLLCFLTLFLLFGTAKNSFAIDQFQAILMKASEAFDQGDYKTSIKLFEGAIKLRPNYVPAYNSVALAYKNDGAKFELVETILKRAIEIDPSYAPVYDNLGKMYYGLGRFDEAEEYSQKAIDRDPTLMSAQQSLAWTYLVGKEDAAKAIEAFKKVVAKEPLPFAYLGLGIAYIMNDQKLMALEVITQLNNLKAEKLAHELEQMVRQGDYRPALRSLHPIKDVQPVVTIDEHQYDAVAEMPVRLKHDNSNSKKRSRERVEEEPTRDVSPAERLRQLRRQAAEGEGRLSSDSQQY